MPRIGAPDIPLPTQAVIGPVDEADEGEGIARERHTPSASQTIPLAQRLPSAESAQARRTWAIVFAGGIGSRFWPLSSARRPKHVLSLVHPTPLIADTLSHLEAIAPIDRTLVVTSADIADVLQAALPQLPTHNLLAEPYPMGTAASLAWAASEVRRRAGPGALVLAVHADLAISLDPLFVSAAESARATAAREEVICCIGIQPTRTERAFGYILPGAALDSDRDDAVAPVKVRQFVEKPDADTADQLIQRGAMWHSGMWIALNDVVLEELARLTPEVAAAIPAAAAGDMASFVRSCAAISLERGLLERSRNLAVVRGEFAWDDVGTWASLRRAMELDDFGNGAVGDARLVDATADVVHAEDGIVVAWGVSRHLIVRTSGLTFVCPLDRADDLRAMLSQLPEDLQQRLDK